MTPTRAAMAVVVREGHVLLVQRRKPPDAGLWGYPGGHLDPGESHETGALRELHEETGVLARAIAVLDVLEVRAEGYAFDLAAVLCAHVAGEPVAADDAMAAEWVPIGDVLAGRPPMSDRVDEVLETALRVLAR